MLSPPFVLRDVIHAYIDFPEDTLGRIALDVLQTRPFQRLRRLHQLGLGRLIFPGAEHSRFSHSLGAYQLCRRAIAELERKGVMPRLDPLDGAAVGLAALLHDLGHGIFSHTSEAIWDFNHETITDCLIREDPELRAIWQAHEPGGDLAERIVRMRNGLGLAPEHAFLHDLVSSQLDVDRMDYILRDAYMTGVRYGGFDLDWLVRHLTLGEWRGRLRLVVQEKASDALAQYLLARFHMYKNVYEHRTARIYDAMLHGLMLRVRQQPPERLHDLGIGWLIDPLGEDLAKYLMLDDYAMWEALKVLAAANLSDPTTRRLAEDLLTDCRWDGTILEGEGVPEPSWQGDAFVAPYTRGRFYDAAPESQVLVQGHAGVRLFSEDTRVLRLEFVEPAAAIRITPPVMARTRALA